MIIRRKLSNSITFLLLLTVVSVNHCATFANTTDDNNRIRRTEITNIGSDKMEQPPAITHISQRRRSSDNKNHENVLIIQSDSHAKSVHQAHDFIMQQHKKRPEYRSSNNNNDDNTLLVSKREEQQVSPPREPEHNERDAFDGTPPQLSQLPLVVPRGRASKLFKSYSTIYDGARAAPVYQATLETTTPETLILTTTSRTNALPLRNEDDENDQESGYGDTEGGDNSDDNNDTNEKINPFLMSAFNFITNAVLSSIKSRQSNLDEGRAQVENKVGELNKGRMDNGSEHIDVTTSAESSTGTETSTTNPPFNDSSLVEQGRYIKGDPLNGYYDFVITEGSYKFWIVFQLLTAVLIIYSTFAAIYYSKVNPIVSDYDYQDYLGGRSFPKGASMVDNNEDIVDPEDDSPTSSQNPSKLSWLTGPWLSRTQHALQFILDAIEQPPK